MAQLLEAMMVLSFGAAWPANIMSSIKARTTKGKSLPFLLIVEFGYACGISSKFVDGSLSYVVYFYILNFIMVFVDILIYIRNYRLDREAASR